MTNVRKTLTTNHFRVMAEFYASGLWVSKTSEEGPEARFGAVSEVEPEDYNVSPSLTRKLANWIQCYEQLSSSVEFEPGAFVEFSKEGLLLAKALKAEFPQASITYYDEAAAEVSFGKGPGHSRRNYVYEVFIDS